MLITILLTCIGFLSITMLCLHFLHWFAYLSSVTFIDKFTIHYRFSDLSTVPLSGVWWPPQQSVWRFPWPVRAFQGGPLCSVLLLPYCAWRRISPLLPWLNLLPGSMQNLINVICHCISIASKKVESEHCLLTDTAREHNIPLLPLCHGLWWRLEVQILEQILQSCGK